MPDGQPPGHGGSDLDAQLVQAQAALSPHPAAGALQARALIARHPREPGPLFLLARALFLLGEHAEAAKALGAALHLSRSNAALTRANRALDTGDLDAVDAALPGELSRPVANPVALLLTGEARLRQGRFGAAIDALGRGLAAAPGYHPLRITLARACYRRFDIDAALEALASPDPEFANNIAARRFTATLLAEKGQFDEAAAILERLLAEHPGEGALALQLGDVERTLGEPAAATARYRAALALLPQRGRAWWSLAAVDAASLTNAELATLTNDHRQALDPADRMHCAFALATRADRDGRYEEAFGLFAEANALHRRTMPWSPDAFVVRSAAIEAEIDEAFHAERADWGAPDPAPVFIVGLPRSGSTLLETMLAAHPSIAAGGELPVISALIREAASDKRLDPERDAAALLESLTRNECRALGEEYLRRARQRVGSAAAHFTDKLPHNWAELDFVRLILPRARSVAIRRDLADCAVSNFALLFSPGHPASYDLEDFTAYAQACLRGVEGFKRRSPDSLVDLRYENLVTEPETALRAVLDHLGLPFDTACLDQSQRRGPVATASAEQVRQPLSTASFGSWRRFEPWLGDLPRRWAALDGEMPS